MQQPRQRATKPQLLRIWGGKPVQMRSWGWQQVWRGTQIPAAQRSKSEDAWKWYCQFVLGTSYILNSLPSHSRVFERAYYIAFGMYSQSKSLSPPLWGVWNVSWSSQPYGGFAEQLIRSRRLEKKPHTSYTIISRHIFFFFGKRGINMKPHSINTKNSNRGAWKKMMSTLQKSLFRQRLRKRCLKLSFQHRLESQIKTGKHTDSKANMSLLSRAANPSKIADDITGHQKKLPFPLRKSQDQTEA